MVPAAKKARARSKPRAKPSAPLWLALSDVPRAAVDFALLLTAAPFLAFAPRGDGHPVMLLPGFGAGDLSLEMLSKYLQWLGYDTHSWNLGQNMGTRTLGAKQERLVQRLQEVHDMTGQKVSLVGWSLGGTFARQLSQNRPDLVRQVVMLGSPLYGTAKSVSLRAAIPVTSIYSRSDGVVPWRFSQIRNGPRTQNIEVHGAHVGLGVNPAVFWALADRLELKEGAWKTFKPSGIAAILFP